MSGTPGAIYLCQVSETVSCGACCGLYNLADASRQGLCRLLSRRTAAFAEVPRETEAILAFGEAESADIARHGQPMPEFHHCPFLGFIGKEKTCVGCLLHPMGEGNNGVDFRGLSHYGSMTCHMYFCPTHRRIPAAFKRIIRTVIDDWYAFGLIVPETELLEAFYTEITDRLNGAPLCLETAVTTETRPLWAELFGVKTRWPFTPGKRPLTNYFFNDSLYPKPPVDYRATGRNGSRYDPIFRELHSVFGSESDLDAAEKTLDDLFSAIARNLSATG